MPISLLILLVPLAALFFVILNSLTMRVVSTQPFTIDVSTTILIPMRNEEANAEKALMSATSQRGLSDFNVRVLDDHSEDSTLSILQKNRSNYRFEIVHGKELPQGWLGKNWACQQLAENIQSKYLVFLDADVELHKHAISNSIHALENWKLDFLSPHPREIALSFFERLIQPMLQWSWMASVPLRLAEKYRIKSMTIANGQFFIVSRDAYLKSGGHAAIRGEVLDDLALARLLVESGFKGTVADASAIATCRMYSSSAELFDGYSKSLWSAFGSRVGAIAASFILISIGLLPIASALFGSAWGYIGYLLVSLSFAISAVKTRSSWGATFLHPVSTLILLGLIVRSFILHKKGRLHWKGRFL